MPSKWDPVISLLTPQDSDISNSRTWVDISPGPPQTFDSLFKKYIETRILKSKWKNSQENRAKRLECIKRLHGAPKEEIYPILQAINYHRQSFEFEPREIKTPYFTYRFQMGHLMWLWFLYQFISIWIEHLGDFIFWIVLLFIFSIAYFPLTFFLTYVMHRVYMKYSSKQKYISLSKTLFDHLDELAATRDRVIQIPRQEGISADYIDSILWESKSIQDICVRIEVLWSEFIRVSQPRSWLKWLYISRSKTHEYQYQEALLLYIKMNIQEITHLLIHTQADIQKNLEKQKERITILQANPESQSALLLQKQRLEMLIQKFQLTI